MLLQYFHDHAQGQSMNWLEKLLGESQVNLLRILRRSQQTITSLAARMGLTDNAVRTHIATLSRNGLVIEAGSQRDTGGKPARMYDLSRQGEELFPKAYATILSELIGQIEASEGQERVVELLRAVGVHASKGV
ncbi:MAG: HTH domain-containing protein, partial [Gemmatimonadota bacterium]